MNWREELDRVKAELDLIQSKNEELRVALKKELVHSQFLSSELRMSEEKLRDWEDTVKNATLAQHDDEVHCSCCAPLRAEVKQLTEAKEKLEADIEKWRIAMREACRAGPMR